MNFNILCLQAFNLEPENGYHASGNLFACSSSSVSDRKIVVQFWRKYCKLFLPEPWILELSIQRGHNNFIVV